MDLKLKPQLKGLIGLVGILATVSSASALSLEFSDTHLYGKYQYEHLGPGETYENKWDISGQEHFSTDLWFEKATVEFWFADDKDSYPTYDKVQIDLGDIVNWWSGDVDGHHTYPYSLDGFDLVSGMFGPGSQILQDIATDGMLKYAVRSLNEYETITYWKTVGYEWKKIEGHWVYYYKWVKVNGKWKKIQKRYWKKDSWKKVAIKKKVTKRIKENDMYLKETRLTVHAKKHVPDAGATALLLGLGLVSLGFVSRKLRK